MEHKKWKMFRGIQQTRKLHRHECDICGFIWEHCERQVAMLTTEAKARAHMCSNCGHVQREIEGADSPRLALSPSERSDQASPDLAKIIELGRLCLQLGRVTRATYHEDGVRPESDTDHTVMLTVVSCAFAEAFAPHLDRGLIAQFSTVHDFVEVHAGDTVTLGINELDMAQKSAREAAALTALAAEFSETLPWLPAQIAAYESQKTPESRFVKVLDKAMPVITHLLNNGAGLIAQGIGLPRLRSMHVAQREKIASSYGADQPEASNLLKAIHGLLDRSAEAAK